MARIEWDDRLISRAEAAGLTGEHPVRWQVEKDSGQLVLRCGADGCGEGYGGQSCGLWSPGAPTSVDEIISGVLRHLVTGHDLHLNIRARERVTGSGRDDDGGHAAGGPGGAAAAAAAAAAGGGGGGVAADGSGPGPDDRDTPDTSAV